MTKEQAVDILSEFYMANVMDYGREYKQTPEIDGVINEIAGHLTEGTKFGMLFCGDTGNGKTTMADAIINATRYLVEYDFITPFYNFSRINAVDVSDFFINDKDAYKRFRDCQNLVLDDLGEEPCEVVSYGMPFYPMLDFMRYRYENRFYTIATSNLSLKQLSDKYKSARFTDRMKEMFERVVFTGGSFR